MIKHALLIATTNKHKLAEFRSLLGDLPVEVVGPDEIWKSPPQVVEDGATFVENATKKARVLAAASTMLTLADDSGLEVDALGGSPGVRSARYAHEGATDAENRTALLSALDSVSLDDPISIRNISASDFAAKSRGAFTARFRCALVLVDPFADGAVQVAEGTCEGSVVRTARGSGGFGYDPIFALKDSDRTMAELSAEEKNRISHRGRALISMRPQLTEALHARARRIQAIFG